MIKEQIIQVERFLLPPTDIVFFSFATTMIHQLTRFLSSAQRRRIEDNVTSIKKADATLVAVTQTVFLSWGFAYVSSRKSHHPAWRHFMHFALSAL